MIEFTHQTTRFTVQPANAQSYRAALGKPAKHKPVALSSVNLKRSYPAFEPGMTTGDYIQRFNSQFDRIQETIEHTCPNYHKSAPMLDPSFPEVVEEVDPDYVEPIRAHKTKKASAADIRRVLADLVSHVRQDVPERQGSRHLWDAVLDAEELLK